MSLQHLGLFLHIVAVVLWVGGMIFTHFCLRPAVQALPPAQRLPLWVALLSRFFPLVWGAIVLLLGTGLAKLLAVGFGAAPTAWHVMMLSGLIMMAVFASIWFGPWAALKRAVAVEDWAGAAVQMNRIRQRVSLNLLLGLLTIAIATLGLAWF